MLGTSHPILIPISQKRIVGNEMKIVESSDFPFLNEEMKSLLKWNVPSGSVIALVEQVNEKFQHLPLGVKYMIFPGSDGTLQMNPIPAERDLSIAYGRVLLLSKDIKNCLSVTCREHLRTKEKKPKYYTVTLLGHSNSTGPEPLLFDFLKNFGKLNKKDQEMKKVFIKAKKDGLQYLTTGKKPKNMTTYEEIDRFMIESVLKTMHIIRQRVLKASDEDVRQSEMELSFSITGRSIFSRMKNIRKYLITVGKVDEKDVDKFIHIPKPGSSTQAETSSTQVYAGSEIFAVCHLTKEQEKEDAARDYLTSIVDIKFGLVKRICDEGVTQVKNEIKENKKAITKLSTELKTTKDELKAEMKKTKEELIGEMEIQKGLMKFELEILMKKAVKGFEKSMKRETKEIKEGLKSTVSIWQFVFVVMIAVFVFILLFRSMNLLEERIVNIEKRINDTGCCVMGVTEEVGYSQVDDFQKGCGDKEVMEEVHMSLGNSLDGIGCDLEE